MCFDAGSILGSGPITASKVADSFCRLNPCIESNSFNERSEKLKHFASLIGAETIVGVRIEKAPDHDAYIVTEAAEVSVGTKHNGAAIKLVDGQPSPSALAELWEVLSGSPNKLFELSQARSQLNTLAVVPTPPPPPPRWMRPASFITGVIALGFGGLMVYEGVKAHNANKRADAAHTSQGSIAMGSNDTYDKAIKDADAANQAMLYSAGATLLFGSAAGVLWYWSREPKPFVVRF